MLDCGRKKVNQLHSVISNRDINLSACRLLLLSVVRPSLEYGSEVWEGNKSQAAALESVLLGGGKRILVITCSPAPFPLIHYSTIMTMVPIVMYGQRLLLLL